jgi:hypothetical protein
MFGGRHKNFVGLHGLYLLKKSQRYLLAAQAVWEQTVG